jgi:Holliday junction resolvasome RuvABC endonuclease subunit
MLVLGLDPSLTNYGWCLTDFEAPSVVVARGRWKTTSDMLFISRYTTLRDEISQKCMEYPEVRYVGIESPPFGEIFSEGLYGLFLYAVEALWKAKRDVFFWDPSTVKSRAKEIIGRDKGKMFKSDMMEAAKILTEEKKWNNDEADALHVAHLTYRFIAFHTNKIKESELTEREQWIFSGVKVNKKTGDVTKRGMQFRENDRFFLFGGHL